MIHPSNSGVSGDGTITNGGGSREKFSYGALIYTNKDKELRNSMIKDACSIFGRITKISTWDNMYVFFPFVCRDCVELLTSLKGEKSVNNPKVPSFIFKNKELMWGWLEQIIADEGTVRYYPSQYERSITWQRSVDITDIYPYFKEEYESSAKKSEVIKKIGECKKCNLIEGERKMLNLLGISCKVRPISIYFTKKGEVKLIWELRISGYENLKKLRELIRIPCKRKDKKFTFILRTYKSF